MKGQIYMKIRKVLGALALCMMTFLAIGCGSSQGAAKADGAGSAQTQTAENTKVDKAVNKTLVVYFSRSGNTEYVAQEIAKETGADIFKVEPTDDSYQADYNTVVDLAKKELQEGARPPFQGQVENIGQYDTIYIGSPVWWGDMPMILYTFLDKYDLSGKKLAPFVTHEGSGLAQIPQNLQKQVPNAKVVDGLALRGSSARSSADEIKSWVEKVKSAQ